MLVYYFFFSFDLIIEMTDPILIVRAICWSSVVVTKRKQIEQISSAV